MQASPNQPKWLLLLLLMLFAYHVVDVIRTVQLPPEIAAATTLPIPLRLMTGVTWAGLSGWSMLRVVRGHSNANQHARYLLVGFVLYTIARLIVFTQAEYDRQRLPFVLVSLAFLMVLFVVVRLLRNKLRGQHEKDGEDFL